MTTYWISKTEKLYRMLWCHYTNSYDIECFICKAHSDCIGEVHDCCREDFLEWDKISDEEKEK